MAAAAQPKDLGKRQRKKISYNEANLARNKSSTSDSEYKGSDIIKEDSDDDDEDGSGSGLEPEGLEGEKVNSPFCCSLSRQCWAFL